VYNSDDEGKKDVLPDEELGMHTDGMDPKLGPIKLSQHEVARQRAAAQVLKANPSGSQPLSSESDNPEGFDMRWSRSHQTFVKNAAKDLSDSEEGNSIVPSPQLSPVPPTDDDDWSWMNPEQRKKAEVAKKALASKPVQPPRCLNAPGTKAPKKSVREPEDAGKPVTRSRDVADPPSSPRVPESPKAAAPQRALADKSKTQEKGQESPGTKVSVHDPHPMATRRSQASRAGGLPSGGGSGQKDTCVNLFHPSETRVVIFFLRGGFLPLATQRRSMAQRDNRLPFRVSGSTPPFGGAPRRCPVQPSTPLGPDQVNVITIIIVLLCGQ
jgi:hypothetical protein